MAGSGAFLGIVGVDECLDNRDGALQQRGVSGEGQTEMVCVRADFPHSFSCADGVVVDQIWV